MVSGAIQRKLPGDLSCDDVVEAAPGWRNSEEPKSIMNACPLALIMMFSLHGTRVKRNRADDSI